MIPSRTKCLELLKKHGYYKEDIPIVHSELVERVALKISDMLISKGVNINRKAVGVASLIHDIGKGNKENKDHAMKGYEICVEEKLNPKICMAVKNHDVDGVMHTLETWEEKVVSYSDKICNTKVMGLEERFNDWIKRFPDDYVKNKKKFDESHAKSILLEKEILNKLGLTSKELYTILGKNYE